MEVIDFEERIKPGILLLNVLGYKLDLTGKLKKWETINILNKENNKIGNAFFNNDSFKMLGEDENFTFDASYKLDKYNEVDKIMANIVRKIEGDEYLISLEFNLYHSYIYNNEIAIKLKIYAGGYKKYELEIPIRRKDIKDLSIRTDQEYFGYTDAPDIISIHHQKENIDSKIYIEKNICLEEYQKIHTVQNIHYENGEDIKNRNYPLNKNEDVYCALGCSMSFISIKPNLLIDINKITNNLLERILSLKFSDYNEEEFLAIFNLSYTNLLSQNREKTINEALPEKANKLILNRKLYRLM